MATIAPIRVRHAADVYHRPVASVANLPDVFTELSPAQLRALAAVLARAADECESLAPETSSYGPVRREYPINTA